MKPISITIGIPAHNEENTIGNLLSSLLSQKRDSYVVNDIIVTCDGCTDNTAEVVEKFKHNVKLINDGKRLGQAGRLNQFFASSNSEVFVTFDADVVLEHDNVLNYLIEPFRNGEIGIVGGNPIPYKGNNILEKSLTAWLKIWYYTRAEYNRGQNIHNHNGKASAVRVAACKDIRIPADIYANDDYLYLSIVRSGYKFCFAPKARVLYSIPATLKDYFLQNSRFISLKQNIFKYFGTETTKYYHIPISYKLKAFTKELFCNPIYTIIAVCLEVALRKNSLRIAEKYKGVSWSTAESTKRSSLNRKGAF